MSNSSTPKVGVGVIVERDGKLLLHRRKGDHGPGTWSTAGGHLDFGETPEACAIREVWEETGVHIGRMQFVGITNDVFAETGRHYITIWMRGEVISGEPTVHAPDEVETVGWFAWDSLPEPLFLPLRHLIDGKLYVSATHDKLPLSRP